MIALDLVTLKAIIKNKKTAKEYIDMKIKERQEDITAMNEWIQNNLT